MYVTNLWEIFAQKYLSDKEVNLHTITSSIMFLLTNGFMQVIGKETITKATGSLLLFMDELYTAISRKHNIKHQPDGVPCQLRLNAVAV